MNLEDLSYGTRKRLYPLIWEAHAAGIPTSQIVYIIFKAADRLSRAFDTAAVLESEEADLPDPPLTRDKSAL